MTGVLRSMLAAAIVLSLLGPAFALREDSTWDPPARFDHPFRGVLTIIRLPQAEVGPACRKVFVANGLSIDTTPRQRGCAYVSGDKRRCTIIVMDRPTFGATPAAVIRHEMGHCNGWPADHPD